MNRNRLLLFLVLLAVLSLSSCSGLHGSSGGGTTGTGTVSITMLATPLTPPPGTNILSFTATINEVSLTPTTGTAQNITLASPFEVDFTQLQSDSIFLGTLTSVPVGTYTVSVSMGAPTVYYCKQPNPGTPGCVSGSITKLGGNAQVPKITATLGVTTGQKTGIALNFNLQNALTINATSQAVTAIDFTATNALTFNTLPSASTSLASGQLDFVEDITGVVTAATSPSVTIKTATHGSITATTTSTTVYAPNTCTTQSFSCVTVGELATMNVAVNSDGTLTVLLFDRVVATSADFLEGVVTATPTSSTQFQIVVNNLAVASTNSVLSGSATSILGTPVNITLVNSATFVVDDQGLLLPTAAVSVFTASNNASILLPGQTVAVLVTSFTAASGNTLATANANALALRFSRVTGSVSSTGSQQFSLQSLPPLFGQTTASLVQLSLGTSAASTNFDGLNSSTGSLTAGQVVSLRALYFGPNAATPFSAAKVRVP